VSDYDNLVAVNLTAKLQQADFGDSGSAARFFYCAKASKRDRNEGLDGFEEKQTVGGGGLTADFREDGSLETASAGGKYGSIKAKQTNHHPTVKPTDLMRYLCRLITPPNGTVLDPFMGSGSTGKAAMYEGFKFIGIEMTDEYLPIAKARIEFAVSDNEGFLL
jgi:site-specific DNA-methyltransferase (adenine-specific)